MFLDWDRHPEWAAEASAWLIDRFGVPLLDRFRNAQVEDWLEWLDREHAEAVGVHCRPVMEDFVVWLVDFDTLRESGLRAWSGGDLRDRARSEFDNLVSEDQLNEAIEECAPDHRGGRVYCFSSLDYSLSMGEGTQPGHLPLFATEPGGEFLSCVRDELGLPWSAKTHNSKAYFLACNIRWDRLETEIRDGLIRDVLTTALVRLCFPHDNFTRQSSYECVSVNHDILPKEIDCISDVQHLVGRVDLVASDIAWSAFNSTPET